MTPTPAAIDRLAADLLRPDHLAERDHARALCDVHEATIADLSARLADERVCSDREAKRASAEIARLTAASGAQDATIARLTGELTAIRSMAGTGANDPAVDTLEVVRRRLECDREIAADLRSMRDSAIADRDDARRERDMAIANRDGLIVERDAVAVERDRLRSERSDLIGAIVGVGEMVGGGLGPAGDERDRAWVRYARSLTDRADSLRAEVAELRARPVLTADHAEQFAAGYIKAKHGDTAWPDDAKSRAALTAPFKIAFAKLGAVTLPLPTPDRAEDLAAAYCDAQREVGGEEWLGWKAVSRSAAVRDLIVGSLRRALTKLAPAPTPSKPADFDFAAFADDKSAWSLRTFGPGARTAGVIDHIRKELAEIERAPTDVSEWVDVIILAMDGAWRSAGADGAALADALVAKMAKNKARTWPDWRAAPADKAIEHVRADGEPSAPSKPADVFAGVTVEVHEHGWQWRPVDGDTAFAPPFATIRACRHCGCLVAGGPNACGRCANTPEADSTPTQPVDVFAGIGDADLAAIARAKYTTSGHSNPWLDCIRAVLDALRVKLVAPVDPEEVAREYYNDIGSPTPDWTEIESGGGYLSDRVRSAQREATAAMRATLAAAGIPVTPEAGK